jgi:DNA-binding MarR family transcriptional regulator
MNNADTYQVLLRKLGLSAEEAKLYLELLEEPSTHLRLAHATGINRTKVYRLIEDLEKKSLVTRRTDDRGTFLVAADPRTLEVGLTEREQKLAAQRAALTQLLPSLENIRKKESRAFIIHTYEGVEGFKQMLWHELKTKGENVIFGKGTIEDAVPDKAWAEKHRAMTVEAGYTVRELLNAGENDYPFTMNEQFMHRYTHRYIRAGILKLDDQISIYNHTVATYHWRNEERVGFEVTSAPYADMMRQLFEHYWQLADN